MIVIPFSRSRSIESITRSGTAWCSRKMPLCFSIASTSVVFPWSTWAMIATLRMSAGECAKGGGLREGAPEEFPDRLPAVLPEEAGTGPREPGVADPDRLPSRRGDPFFVFPGEPGVPPLVEHEDRFVAQLGELRAPPRASLDGPVREDGADHVDLLPRVHLVPYRLQDLPDGGGIRVAAVHQTGHVGEAHVPLRQLLPGEDPDAAGAGEGVPLEREVDLLDPARLRLGAE